MTLQCTIQPISPTTGSGTPLGAPSKETLQKMGTPSPSYSGVSSTLPSPTVIPSSMSLYGERQRSSSSGMPVPSPPFLGVFPGTSWAAPSSSSHNVLPTTSSSNSTGSHDSLESLASRVISSSMVSSTRSFPSPFFSSPSVFCTCRAFSCWSMDSSVLFLCIVCSLLLTSVLHCPASSSTNSSLHPVSPSLNI